MEGRKYFLSRKWFRTSYTVTDESGKLYCHIKRRGFLVYEIYLYDLNGEKMMTAFQEEADLASYTFFGQGGCSLLCAAWDGGHYKEDGQSRRDYSIVNAAYPSISPKTETVLLSQMEDISAS